MAAPAHNAVEGPTLGDLEDKIFRGNRFGKHMHNYSEGIVDDESAKYSVKSVVSDSSHVSTTGSITWWVAKKRAEILYANQSVFNPEFTEDFHSVCDNTSLATVPIMEGEIFNDHAEERVTQPIRRTTKVVANLIKNAAANKTQTSSSGPHSTIGTVKGWNTAVQSVENATTLLQGQFRKRMARNRVFYLRSEKAMRWRIINMLLRFVRRFRLKQKRATKMKATLRLQTWTRSFLARKRVLHIVSAGIKIVTAYKRYLQVSQMRFALRRILRPIQVKLFQLENIPVNSLTNDKIKVRINVWWHSVLHMANASDVVAILQTKKPQYVFTTPMYHVERTDTSKTGEVFGKVVFSAKALVQHKLGVLGATSHLTKALVTGAAGAAGSIVHGTAGVVMHGAGAVIHGADAVIHGTQSLLHKNQTSPLQSAENSAVRVSDKSDSRSPALSPEDTPVEGNSTYSKRRKPVVEEKENGISIIIPACHSNCYVRMDLMDDMGHVVAAYTYAMKKRGNLMFWGVARGETTKSWLMSIKQNHRATKLPGGGAGGLNSTLLTAHNRGHAKVSPMATLKEVGSASGEASQEDKGLFKPISVPPASSSKSKKISLLGGARGGRKPRAPQGSTAAGRHTCIEWHISPGIQCTWALAEVSGRGPLSHKVIPLTGIYDMAVKALEERGYITERKNYSRFMLCLMQDELLLCKNRSDSSPEMSIKLLSVTNISAELSQTPCYMYQIDPLVKEGSVGGGVIGTMMRKAIAAFDTAEDLKTGIGGQAMDTYDVVLELVSGDIINLRFSDMKVRNMWIYFIGNYCSLAIEKLKMREEQEAKRAALEAEARRIIVANENNEVSDSSKQSSNSMKSDRGHLMKGISQRLGIGSSSKGSGSLPCSLPESEENSASSFRISNKGRVNM